MFTFPNFIHKNLRRTRHQTIRLNMSHLDMRAPCKEKAVSLRVLWWTVLERVNMSSSSSFSCITASDIVIFTVQCSARDVSLPVQTWCWCRRLQLTRWLVGSPARSHRHHISILYAGWSFLRLYKQPSCQIKLRPGNSYQQLSYNNIIQRQPFPSSQSIQIHFDLCK